MQRADPAHERVSLVRVDIADSAADLLFILLQPLFDIEFDRLHRRARAHVVQERVSVVRAEQRRVRESERERGFGERQLGPRTEVPTWCVSAVHRCGERRRTSLSLVRRRMACGSLVVDRKVAGEAPDFDAVVDAVKDEIAIFVLAVGQGANVRLGISFVSTAS